MYIGFLQMKDRTKPQTTLDRRESKLLAKSKQYSVPGIDNKVGRMPGS